MGGGSVALIREPDLTAAGAAYGIHIKRTEIGDFYMRHAAQLVECFRTAFNYHVIHGSSILHADIMGMLKAAPVGAADAVFKQNALGYRHTGFVVRRVFGRAVERRHEADIQRISIRAGDGFTDFCFCNAHILIRSVGMHGKILEEAADGVSA